MIIPFTVRPSNTAFVPDATDTETENGSLELPSEACAQATDGFISVSRTVMCGGCCPLTAIPSPSSSHGEASGTEPLYVYVLFADVMRTATGPETPSGAYGTLATLLFCASTAIPHQNAKMHTKSNTSDHVPE